MPAYYEYRTAIYGTQSTDENGDPVDFSTYPTGTWQYSGSLTRFVVEENNRNNTDFDGDRPPGTISNNNRFGQGNQQTAEVDGTARQIAWDYTFQVRDPLTGDTWNIAVIDVDLDNDSALNSTTESGYYLVFTDGVPPTGTVLEIVGVVEDDVHTPHLDLGGTIVCFAAGTLIETREGPRPVEALTEGDMVLTRDDGFQPLRWIGTTRVPAFRQFAPVVIGKGALGNETDLIVSPQHAVLLNDWRAQLLYGDEDVLVRAKDLLHLKGVNQREGGFVTYCHILFDRHQLVKASGIWSESLYPGDMTRQSVNDAARAEIEALFPEIEAFGPKNARCLRRFEARCLAA